MTETIDTSTDAPNQNSDIEVPQKRVKFYRHQRIIRPLLVGIFVLFFTHGFLLAFFSYILFGIAWDWLIFDHDGLRDSQKLPESDFNEIGFTGQQVDELNSFNVTLRRVACSASISTTAAAALFWPTFYYGIVFVLTYIAVTLVSIIVATKKGKIIFPYRFVDRGELVESAYPTSILWSSKYVAGSSSSINNPFA